MVGASRGRDSSNRSNTYTHTAHFPALNHPANSLTSLRAATSSRSSLPLATSTTVLFLPWLISTRPTRRGENEMLSAENGIGCGFVEVRGRREEVVT